MDLQSLVNFTAFLLVAYAATLGGGHEHARHPEPPPVYECWGYAVADVDGVGEKETCIRYWDN
jgi:hypothetical protein